MFTVLLDEDPLALGAFFACLGAMGCGRCELSAGREGREEEEGNLS